MQAGPPPLWLEGLRTPWASTLAEQGISLQPRNGRKRLDPHLHHFDAIAATLPLGSVAYEAEANERGERLIWLEAAMVDRLGAMRGPDESYSDVILRIASESA